MAPRASRPEVPEKGDDLELPMQAETGLAWPWLSAFITVSARVARAEATRWWGREGFGLARQPLGPRMVIGRSAGVQGMWPWSLGIEQHRADGEPASRVSAVPFQGMLSGRSGTSARAGEVDHRARPFGDGDDARQFFWWDRRGRDSRRSPSRAR